MEKDWERKTLRYYEDFSALYQRYMTTEICEICKIKTNVEYGYRGDDR